MKKSNTILIALILLSAAFFTWALVRSQKQAPAIAQNGAEKNLPAATLPLEGQTNNEGGVEVSVQPQDVQSNEWTFGVAMNTHIGSLDADLVKSATLADERGNIFAPIRWDGASPGGHHRQGILTFNAIAPRPDSITLLIKDVGGVAERKFTWQLNVVDK